MISERDGYRDGWIGSTTDRLLTLRATNLWLSGRSKDKLTALARQLGLFYWYAILPPHDLIFAGLCNTIVQRAERLAAPMPCADCKVCKGEGADGERVLRAASPESFIACSSVAPTFAPSLPKTVPQTEFAPAGQSAPDRGQRSHHTGWRPNLARPLTRGRSNRAAFGRSDSPPPIAAKR